MCYAGEEVMPIFPQEKEVFQDDKDQTDLLTNLFPHFPDLAYPKPLYSHNLTLIQILHLYLMQN